MRNCAKATRSFTWNIILFGQTDWSSRGKHSQHLHEVLGSSLAPRARFAPQVNYLLLVEEGVEAELISWWSAGWRGSPLIHSPRPHVIAEVVEREILRQKKQDYQAILPRTGHNCSRQKIPENPRRLTAILCLHILLPTGFYSSIMREMMVEGWLCCAIMIHRKLIEKSQESSPTESEVITLMMRQVGAKVSAKGRIAFWIVQNKVWLKRPALLRFYTRTFYLVHR